MSLAAKKVSGGELWREGGSTVPPKNGKLGSHTVDIQADQPKITAAAFSGQNAANDSTSGYRMGTGAVITDFPNSIAYQSLGITNATASLTGGYGILSSYRGFQEAKKIKDQRGKDRAFLDGVTSGTAVVFGLDYAILRTANIGKVLDPSSFSTLAKYTDQIGSVVITLLYWLATIGELFKAGEISHLKAKIEKRTLSIDKIGYLRHRLYVGPNALQEKEEKKLLKRVSLEEGDPRISRLAMERIEKRALEVAVDEQKMLVKRHIAYLRKEGKEVIPLRDREISQFVENNLSRGALVGRGKEILSDRLQEKKIAKLTRVLGKKTVTDLQRIETVPAGRDYVEECQRIESVVMKTIHTERRGALIRAGVYLVGGAAILAFGLLSFGVIPATFGVVLGISLIYTLVNAAEFKISLSRLIALKNEAGPVGKYDHIFPWLSIGLAVASLVLAIALTSVFSLGIAPVVLASIGVAIWIGLALYHHYALGKKRQNWEQKQAKELRSLVENKGKAGLTLEEAVYLLHAKKEVVPFKEVKDVLLQFAIGGRGADPLKYEEKEALNTEFGMNENTQYWDFLDTLEEGQRDQLAEALIKIIEQRERQSLIKLEDLLLSD